MDSQPNNLKDLYFDELTRYLGDVPEFQREIDIAEISSHIDEMAAEKTASGVDPQRALTDALAQMGDAKYVGDKLAEEWILTSGAIRSKLITRIVLCGVVAAAASTALNFGQSLLANEFFREYRDIPPIAVALLNTLSSFFQIVVIVVVGVTVGRAWPRGAKAISVLPAAIYACLLFDLLTMSSTPILIQITNIFHTGSTQPLPRLFFPSVPWLADMLICMTCYLAASARNLSLRRMPKLNWKLRVE